VLTSILALTVARPTRAQDWFEIQVYDAETAPPAASLGVEHNLADNEDRWVINLNAEFGE
jgi:hypothetical protein